MKSNPTVSVVIPTYNRAHMIGRAIQSVLAQTYQDFEVVIVDDGSTDNTEEVVKGFGDERLRYIRHKQNSGGCAEPRNTGIKAARGEYIALLDSDDEWLPEKLEKQVDKFKSVSPDVGIIYCGYVHVIEKTGEILVENMPIERGDVFQSAVEGSIAMGDTTPLIRKECYQQVGVYDAALLSCESSDMWIRLSKHYEFDFVPEILCKFYTHSEEASSNLEGRIEGLDRITRKYQNYLSKTVVSNRFRRLGTLCCYQGDFKKASGYFKEAIGNNPRDIYNYIRFLVCKLAPRLYQARLKKLYAKSSSKHDGIIFW